VHPASLLGRNCREGFHALCEGQAAVTRLHPAALRHKGSYDQPFPCLCDCHAEYGEHSRL
jgi:hypothetical protein